MGSGEGWGRGRLGRGDEGKGGWVPAYARTRDGLAGSCSRGEGWVGGVPYARGQREGLAPSCSRGEGWGGAGDGRREGRRDSSTSLRSVGHVRDGGNGGVGGRDGLAGSCSRGGGMDPRMREDNGGGMGGVCTPILTFPPEGGREGRDGLAGSCSRGGGYSRGQPSPSPPNRSAGRWVPAPVFTRAGYSRGHGRGGG